MRIVDAETKRFHSKASAQDGGAASSSTLRGSGRTTTTPFPRHDYDCFTFFAVSFRRLFRSLTSLCLFIIVRRRRLMLMPRAGRAPKRPGAPAPGAASGIGAEEGEEAAVTLALLAVKALALRRDDMRRHVHDDAAGSAERRDAGATSCRAATFRPRIAHRAAARMMNARAV